jgi:hypothetical protein
MAVDASAVSALFTFYDLDLDQMVEGPAISIDPLAGAEWFFMPDDGTGQARYYLSGYSGGDGRRLPIRLM